MWYRKAYLGIFIIVCMSFYFCHMYRMVVSESRLSEYFHFRSLCRAALFTSSFLPEIFDRHEGEFALGLFGFLSHKLGQLLSVHTADILSIQSNNQIARTHEALHG